MPRNHPHFETYAQKQRREFREEITAYVADATLKRKRYQSARILTAC
ncbi:hypothetical protein GCM10007094_23730 [Pseudovibrio japonicus]|uniref:Transposase n=1 Tax=Pseudovibrio japonicus TaxID=366534 RepID=A0ABQ3EDF0_9HYPH|nr:hypothetical protein [Pseudovibrio japonicus]GHB34001.1 hypothetical protein GCM10007094_23730 [Pseudovibrio japonicus]